MPNEQRSHYLNRGRILKLLSDEEIAQVSRADVAVRLSEGEEYLDLGDLERGVRRAQGTAMSMRGVLSKKAVSVHTWSDILTQLAMPIGSPDSMALPHSRASPESAVLARSAELTGLDEAEEALDPFVHDGTQARREIFDWGS